MEGEKKPLEILIVEDSPFDAQEDYRDRCSTYESEIYKTFPSRLVEALTQKGHPVLEVTVRPKYERRVIPWLEWKKEDNLLIPKYDVILSDLGFRTECSIPTEEMINQPGFRKKLEESIHAILEELTKLGNCKENLDWRYKSNREYLEKYLEYAKSGDIDKIFKRWFPSSNGFLPLGLEAKRQGKKVTYYTKDVGHGFRNLILGTVYELFGPEDVAEVIIGEASMKDSVDIVSSKKGNLVVGEKNHFGNWVKAVEIAIKYQTE